jgi:hypothetical protein
MNGNTYDFLSSIKSYRYDIQGVWYIKALADYYAVKEVDGVISPFRFIVESTSRQGKPLVYELSESMMNIGRYGRQPFVSTYGHLLSPEIKGVLQLVDMYKYHEEHGWEAEVEIHEADMKEEVLIVDWNGFVSTNAFVKEFKIETGSNLEVEFKFDTAIEGVEARTEEELNGEEQQ